MASSESAGISQIGRRPRLLLLTMLAVGALPRLYLAATTFLNPDEALHYFVSSQPSLNSAYEASLTMAHPPLMIFLLHFWEKLDSSEFFLRLPFVAAGILFAWVMFLWVEKVLGSSAATCALALSLFLPSLITLSAEIRQYSLLLLFCALCLYLLELGLERNSAAWIAASSSVLYLALITHYSGLIFAGAAGVYGLLRITGIGIRLKLTWAAGQIGGLAICGLLYETQIEPLHKSGVPSEIAATWLSTSIFHPGREHAIVFAASKSARLFRYFFSHGTIGVIALLLFLTGIYALLFCRTETDGRKRALGALCLLPFLIAIATALAGVYPYGGTRHDVVLVLFAIPGISAGLRSRMRFLTTKSTKVHEGSQSETLRAGIKWIPFSWPEIKCVLVAAALVICNVFSSPSGPYICPRCQQRALMLSAVSFVESQPSDATILTDYQSGLVLQYYGCGRVSALPFGETTDQPIRWRCGNRAMLTSVRNQQGFGIEELPTVIHQTERLTLRDVLLFQTGWINDKPVAWASALQGAGCGNIQYFGPNIRACTIAGTPVKP